MTVRLAPVTLLSMPEHVSLAEAKKHLAELVERVDRHHARAVVTVHGKPSALLVSPDDIASLEETIDILADDATVQRLIAADAELADGRGETQADLRRAMSHRSTQTTAADGDAPGHPGPSSTDGDERAEPGHSDAGHPAETPQGRLARMRRAAASIQVRAAAGEGTWPTDDAMYDADGLPR